MLGVAQRLDEAGKLEDLDVGRAVGGPVVPPADDYIAAASDCTGQQNQVPSSRQYSPLRG